MPFATINQQALAKNTTPSHSTPNIPAIEDAFTAEPSLKKRVYDAIGTTPQHAPLFEDIARYTTTLLAGNATPTTTTTTSQQQQQHTVPIDTTDNGPAAKKRKLQNGDALGNAQSADVKAESSLQFYMPDVSFAIPQRKKLTLEVTGGRGYLRARNQTTKDVEFGVAMDRIQHVVCVPVPEKTQKQFNFCIIPQYSDGINPPPEGETASEAMVWAINDGPPKAAYSGTGQPMALGEGETAEKLARRILNNNLSQTKVITPDEREFASATPEAHRKGEKAYHVKAFRGSKEGYLFFLSTGFLFGFKKPLVFFAFENIESVSYTSILQRTFNLNVVARPTTSDETQEIEFSMIDQADFAGIDGYIKKHGLQDASLAEARRAKRYNVNNGGVKAENGDANGNNPEAAAGEGEESELQKAERELDDQEDEEEEDYDPGNESDSGGSGSSSDENDDDDDDEEEEEEEEDDDEEKDIIADELGSAAEDVPEEL